MLRQFSDYFKLIMADLSVMREKFVEFCRYFKLDLEAFHPTQFIPDDLFHGRHGDHYLTKGTVSLWPS